MSEATPNTAQGGSTRFQFRPGKPILSQNDADNGVTENALLMGIDLGTSRSSIVSMNGIRKTVESYVGYAKDPVSRKFLKTDVVYGKAALDNRLSVDLYRPLEKGVIKGTLEGPSAYLMKSPPVQYTDDAARELVEDFIAQNARGSAKAAAAGKVEAAS